MPRKSKKTQKEAEPSLIEQIFELMKEYPKTSAAALLSLTALIMSFIISPLIVVLILSAYIILDAVIKEHKEKGAEK